jgi:hypothetical protein
LITKIKSEEIAKLRKKAGSAIPSLPVTPVVARGVEFEHSPVMTSALQSTLQLALGGYQSYLAKIGYAPANDVLILVRINQNDRASAYFAGNEVSIGRDLAADPEYLLLEYTWYVLQQSNPRAFGFLRKRRSGKRGDKGADQLESFAQALKSYFTCSYRRDSVVGRNFRALTGLTTDSRSGALSDLETFKTLDETKSFPNDPHERGEIWGGALWELRKEFGQQEVDRLVLEAWKRFPPSWPHPENGQYYVNAIVDANQAIGSGLEPSKIRLSFSRRRLY